MEAKLDKATEARVKPYLLPKNHPATPVLDEIFSTPGVLLNEKTLKKAGFVGSKPRKFTHLIVTRHPKLPGYVIKTYLDSQRYYKRKPEHELWLMRIQGVNKINQVIANHGWQDLFKTPRKWMYRVPKSKKTKNYLTKNFILIEEDMDLRSERGNLALWKSRQVTQEQLQALYVILESVGLRDCATPDNIPFSHDGRIAFIDTQSHGAKVPFSDLNDYLSSSNRRFWRALTQKK